MSEACTRLPRVNLFTRVSGEAIFNGQDNNDVDASNEKHSSVVALTILSLFSRTFQYVRRPLPFLSFLRHVSGFPESNDLLSCFQLFRAGL